MPPASCSSDQSCGSGKYCTSCIGNYIVNHNCVSGGVYSCCLNCNYPLADCNGGGGCETNLASDVNNCGSCGNKCLSGNTCVSGICKVPPNPPCIDSDNDGFYSNAFACGAGSSKQDCNDNDKFKWQLLTGYVDADGDSYTVGSQVSVCSGNSLPSGYKAAASSEPDCNDNNIKIHPGATDVCGNGVDENCFAGDAACACSDKDGDGYGSPGQSTCPKGSATDCNDNNVNINPGATDICGNSIDENCFGGDASCACGNSVLDSGEVCDPGVISSTKTKMLDCGAYPGVTQMCKSDCSGYDGICPSCGDSVVNGPEECEAW